MSSDGDELEGGVDRRTLLTQLILFTSLAACRRAGPPVADAGPPPQPKPAETQAFAPFHRETLDATMDRILPADGPGPSALAAHAPDFVDRELARPELAELRKLVQGGLLALDRRAQNQAKKRFKDLSLSERDDLLHQMASGPGQGADFVRLMVKLTLEGTYSDPRHGGNFQEIAFQYLGYAPPRKVL